MTLLFSGPDTGHAGILGTDLWTLSAAFGSVPGGGERQVIRMTVINPATMIRAATT
jgi:hypothetical protein